MPAQPAWFHRLNIILDQLSHLSMDWLDRHAIEKLFSVRQRRARQIMADLPAIRIGNAAAIDRRHLIAKLKQLQATAEWQQEHRRKSRVAAYLEQARLELAARKVKLPVGPPAREQRMEGLSPHIDLRPGELRITFSSAEELAGRLFELSNAMAHDWPRFSDVVTPRR